MKLVIVRHGDPDYEHNTLTEKGKREAELLAPRFDNMDVTAFFVSPLGRAQETAAPILSRLHRTAETLPWLREFTEILVRRLDSPEKPTCCWDWMPDDLADYPILFDKDRWGEAPIMKENGIKAYYDRIVGEFDAFLAKCGYQREMSYYRVMRSNLDTYVLICHFGLECVLLSRLWNVSPVPLWQGTIAQTTGVTEVVTEERRNGIASFRMLTFGDVTHLTSAGEPPSFSGRFRESYPNNTWQRI